MTGPRRRTAVQAAPGLNYAAIGATAAADVVSFPPEGFKAAEYRHRIGSGAHRFATAVRTLMTWEALRAAGFRVEDVRAEASAASVRGHGPRFTDDGVPWITPGMTARVSADDASSTGRVQVVSVVEEHRHVGIVFGSMPGHSAVGERRLAVEHDDEDSVWATLRSIWQPPATRWGVRPRSDEARQRRIDERIVRALHPSYSR